MPAFIIQRKCGSRLEYFYSLGNDGQTPTFTGDRGRAQAFPRHADAVPLCRWMQKTAARDHSGVYCEYQVMVRP